MQALALVLVFDVVWHPLQCFQRQRVALALLAIDTEDEGVERILVDEHARVAVAFAQRYFIGSPQVVWTTLVADLETPVSAFIKVAGARPMSFLLESVEGGAVRGRYSIIGLDPDLVWRTNGARAEMNRTARTTPARCLRFAV